MEEDLAEASILLNAVCVMVERLLVLAQHLVALTRIHIELSQLLLVTVRVISLLSANRGTEVVQSSLVLLKVHVAAASHTESSSVVGVFTAGI